MEHWPQSSSEGPREPEHVVEGELVGAPGPKPSWLRRLFRRWVLAVFSAVLGAVFCAAGAILTATIIGALIGLPLLFLGLALILAALWLALGGGEVVVWSSRQGSGRDSWPK